MKRFFISVDSGIVKVQEVIVGTGLIFATLIIVFNTVLRYFFNASLVWAEESVRYVMIWVVFLASSLCIRHNIHVKIDILQLNLPFKARKILIMGIYLICIAFCLLLLQYSTQLTRQLFILGQISTSMLWLEMWIVNLAIPVFGILGTRDFIQLLILNVIHKDKIIRTVGVKDAKPEMKPDDKDKTDAGGNIETRGEAK
ncbi:MAG: TRAP transporter small permease [Defluviitaleaceae bacterium]|nr:TRAP transporter small permease [Defluviitaleaceae bacterium]